MSSVKVVTSDCATLIAVWSIVSKTVVSVYTSRFRELGGNGGGGVVGYDGGPSASDPSSAPFSPW